MKKNKNKNKNLTVEKFIASQTNFSRRKILELIKNRKITVNGGLVSSIGHEVSKSDTVRVDGVVVHFTTPLLYYKLHKPANVICTLSDPKGRKTIRDLIPQLSEALFPVGRLDRNTKGLLLLTNDGDFANLLTHPKYHIPKIYRVVLTKPLSKAQVQQLTQGIFLEDGPVFFNNLEWEDPLTLIVSISEGRNRIIRRTFEYFGNEVQKLKRLSVGPVNLGKLEEGCYKALSAREVSALKKMLGHHSAK